jgi:hypothetical protein
MKGISESDVCGALSESGMPQTRLDLYWLVFGACQDGANASVFLAELREYLGLQA